jgi:hypothetical protein
MGRQLAEMWGEGSAAEFGVPNAAYVWMQSKDAECRLQNEA